MTREELEYRIINLTNELLDAYDAGADELTIELIGKELAQAENELDDYDTIRKYNDTDTR